MLIYRLHSAPLAVAGVDGGGGCVVVVACSLFTPVLFFAIPPLRLLYGVFVIIGGVVGGVGVGVVMVVVVVVVLAVASGSTLARRPSRNTSAYCRNKKKKS